MGGIAHNVIGNNNVTMVNGRILRHAQGASISIINGMTFVNGRRIDANGTECPSEPVVERAYVGDTISDFATMVVSIGDKNWLAYQRYGACTLTVVPEQAVRLADFYQSAAFGPGTYGALDLATSTGTAQLTGVQCPSLRAKSQSGEVTWQGGSCPSVHASSQSGSISLEGAWKHVTLQSMSGSIDLEGNAQEASLSSMSGSVHVDGDVANLDASSMSGSVTLKGKGVARASSMSGRVKYGGYTRA